jgi:hypothetical protein
MPSYLSAIHQAKRLPGPQTKERTPVNCSVRTSLHQLKCYLVKGSIPRLLDIKHEQTKPSSPSKFIESYVSIVIFLTKMHSPKLRGTIPVSSQFFLKTLVLV